MEKAVLIKKACISIGFVILIINDVDLSKALFIFVTGMTR